MIDLQTPALLLALAPLCFAQEESPEFYLAAPGPIIERSEPGSWDHAYNDPGAVLLHEGVLHMFNNGFDGWPTTSGISHYTSEDGLQWKAASKGPIFRAGDHDSDGFGLVATSAGVTQEDEWRIYLTQLKAEPGKGVRGIAFRMLEADGPQGAWKLRDQPLLLPGKGEAWDSRHMSDPMVLSSERGYRMYYSGTDASGVHRVGLAKSKDGLHWSKYSSQAGAEPGLSQPILEPSADWELGVHYPSLVRTRGGYGMVCRAPGKGGSVRLGRAFSKDGVVWTKGAIPVFEPAAIEGNRTVNITALVEHEGTLFLYVDGFVGGQFSLPYVLSAEGDLFAGLWK